MFELEFKQPFSLIRIDFEEFLYKGNVGVVGEMLSKFFQNPCFCFGHNSSKLSDSNLWVN